MTLTFHRYGSTDTTDALELDETKSSIIDKLNEPTRLSAILTSETAPQIALGNYTTYNGTRYYVTKEPTVRKEHSKLYTVEVDLERSLGLGRITILANPIDHRTTFDYTATATEHLQLIVDCLNAKFGEVGLKWTRGAVHCKDTVKHIKYDGATVLDALQQIRETYETDIFAVGETLSLGQTDDKTTALPLAYGKGKGLLSGLERHKHTDDTVPTRLYVTGTKRNMVTGRLTLEKDVVLAVDPKSGTIERHSGGVDIKPDGRTLYRTDKAGQYIAEWSPTEQFVQWGYRFPTEATYTNEEIYPSHVSTIKSVTKVKDHFEVNSDFDYSTLQIDGEQMQVVFQSGNLAGREFDAKHFANSGRLAIVPKEEDDTTLPNDTLCPKVGDQYIVTGIKLPDQYITEAQRKLTDEALRHLVKLQETRYSYKADIDPVYLHNKHDTIAPQLAVGRYVRLTDPQITIGDPYVRIVGKRTYLDRPYTPEIELSNEIEPPSELTRISDKLTTSAEDLRKRLGTAEEELRKKLGSEDFSKWQAGDYAKALAGKASTVDVKQSAQRAIAEAIKRAGEMDKQIKVGGRNLIRNSDKSLSNSDYFVGRYYISDPSLMVAGEDYTIRIWGEIEGADYSEAMWVYNSGGSTQVARIQKNENGVWQMTFKWRDDSGKSNSYLNLYRGANHPNNKKSYNTTITRIKLERGTISTDWTPAPEDVAESVAKVSTSVTDLNRTLLDPEQGEIHKLADILNKHKEDTDKNFDDLATHPLTIDKDGLWQIWDVRKQKYVTTTYPSRGEPGHSPDPEEVLGTERFKQLLGGEVTTQIAPVSKELETTKQIATEGVEVAQHTLDELDKTKREEIAELLGRTDRFDAELGATQLNLEGAKNDIREAFARADSAEDAAIDARNLASDVDGKLATTTTNITNLQAVALTTEQKKDLGYLTGSIRALMSSGGETLEGLMLQRFIGLSGNNKDISAYLASYPLDAVLKAGITDFGTANEREQVAINHNGTGHFGNLYFAGNHIDFRTGRDADPYLSIGAEDMVPIATFVKSARVDDTPISTSSVQLTTSSKVYERAVDVADDGTRLTITIDELLADCYDLDYAVLTLDGSNLASWQGNTKMRENGQMTTDGKTGFVRTPYEAQNLAYERVVSKGRHTVRLELIAKSGQVTFTGFKVKRRYDTGRQQSLLTRSGLRLFGSPDRYFDVDYTPTEKYKLLGQEYTRPNPYIVRIKGGAKIDELDTPGVPLCGASFNESGGCINSFGERAKQQGGSVVQAYRAYNADFYRVYHSIGHKRYIPVLQVYGLSNGNYTQCLTTRIDAIESDSFAVRIVTSGNVSIKHSFSYVAFKTTD